MIAYTFLVVLTLVVAYFEARDDARAIGKHDPISHKVQVWERVRMLGVLVACTTVASCWKDGTVVWHWNTLFFIPICWAAFTMPFRWIINWFRVLHFCYVSKSNSYDRFWLRIAGQREYMSVVYPKRARRAGKYAYLFELSILALSTWAYFSNI